MWWWRLQRTIPTLKQSRFSIVQTLLCFSTRQIKIFRARGDHAETHKPCSFNIITPFYPKMTNIIWLILCIDTNTVLAIPQYDMAISLIENANKKFKRGSLRIPIRIYNSQSDYFSTLYFDSDFLSLRLFCIMTTPNNRIWIVLLLRMHQTMTNANIGV